MIPQQDAYEMVYDIIQLWFPDAELRPTSQLSDYGITTSQIKDLADQLNRQLRPPLIQPSESDSWATLRDVIATVMMKTTIDGVWSPDVPPTSPGSKPPTGR